MTGDPTLSGRKNVDSSKNSNLNVRYIEILSPLCQLCFYALRATLARSWPLLLIFYMLLSFFIIDASSPVFADAADIIVNSSISGNIDEIKVIFVKIPLFVIAIVIILRVANGKKLGRFLIHLALAYGFILLSMFCRLTLIFTKAYIASVSLPTTIAQEKSAESIRKISDYNFSEPAITIASLTSTWAVIDISLSLFSSFFTILTAYLVRKYPREGVSNNFMAISIGVFSFSIGFLAIVGSVVPRAHLERFVDWLFMIDVLLACFTLSALGVSLIRFRVPLMSYGLVLMAIITGFMFVVWGLVQPISYALDLLDGSTKPGLLSEYFIRFYKYTFYKYTYTSVGIGFQCNDLCLQQAKHVYKVLLFGLGFACANLCAIFSSLALIDKERYSDW